MYNSAMKQVDHYVSICNVGKETHNLILLESPPPYRQDLQIDVGTLTGLLGMAGSSGDQVRLGFEPRQEIVHATPSEGRLAVMTKATQFREEKNRGPRQVTYNPRRQELKLTITYLDNETKTSTTTAKNLSEKLARALSVVPAEKYLTNLDGRSNGESLSGQAAELAMFTARIAVNILGAPIVYGTLSALTNAPRPLEAIGILAVANMADVAMELSLGLSLLNGKPVDEKKEWMARTIAEKLPRAVYPVSLVQEFLLPTAKILAHNSVTSGQLLKSSKE